MKQVKRSKIPALIPAVVFVLFFLNIGTAYGQNFCHLRGTITNEQNLPLPGVLITLKTESGSFATSTVGNEHGIFAFSGIPLEKITLAFEKKGYTTCSTVIPRPDPGQAVFVRVFLVPPEGKSSSRINFTMLDSTQNLVQTVLTESNINHYPAAHNIWSLVENQDLSATTNRIDVGGLWGNIPGIFSVRGGMSWTQNIFLLNGMDITDPYWTGFPLFQPDIYSLYLIQSVSGGYPSQAYAPGAFFNLITKEGVNKHHGGLSFFAIDHSLQSSNIIPALQDEGIHESNQFNNMREGNLHLSGPLVPGKMFFFTSLSSSRISRDIADFEEDSISTLNSGLFGIDYYFSRSRLKILWTGQIAEHSADGADRNVPFSATNQTKNTANILQAIWDKHFQDRHYIRAGLSIAQARQKSDFQEGADQPYGLNLFSNLQYGSAPMAFDDNRLTFSLSLHGESLFGDSPKISHRLSYGMQAQYASSSSHKEIKENLHLHYFNGLPLEIIRYNTPVEHKEAALHLNVYAQDTLTFSQFLSLYAGLHILVSNGWNPGADSGTPPETYGLDLEEYNKENVISWLNISPRLGIIIPLSKKKTAAVKISVSRFYYTLPLNYMTVGNTLALGGWVYRWNDNNHDGLFQDDEEGILLRREGPYFGRIDHDLKRPYTDSFAASLEKIFNNTLHISLCGFYRESRNLPATVNIGIPASAYDPALLFDIGDDRIPYSHDDLEFIVYNQDPESFGHDFFLLTTPDAEKRMTKYRGLDLTLVKKHGERLLLYFSLTATEAEGTTNPGNSEWENDDAILGSLYDNPNTMINARGRVRFDRAYTLRFGFSYLAPFDIRISGILKYYDGQPFSRMIIVPDFNQGPFTIQANPRGLSRYEYNRTINVRIEKIFKLGGSNLRFILDGFNLTNRNLATEENEWTSDLYPRRYATEIQSPRVFRLGVAYDF
ncbi:MAG: carboxypeptidase regulatory-like domain-containing protein [Candidatus Aminicenantes bacterium]|nr:carboxypeptidase regulatory-like domain-containing protein [Candidatus Aminicenantes bacterium]